MATEQPIVSEKQEVIGDEKRGNDSSSLESYTNPDGITEKALLRKLDWKLLPGLTLLYLLSFLDRSNGMFLPEVCPSSVSSGGEENEWTYANLGLQLEMRGLMGWQRICILREINTCLL